MKTLKILSVFVLSLMLNSVKAQPSESGQLGKINPEFQKQLGLVVQSAGALSEVFATDDPAKVNEAAQKVKEAIAATDMHLLSGENHMNWMKYMNSMNEQIDGILATGNIESKRVSFADFNDTLHNSVKDFGVRDEISYYQFCPMALNNKGAFWFSNAKEIRNPYLGSKMLTCGMTKETIQ